VPRPVNRKKTAASRSYQRDPANFDDWRSSIRGAESAACFDLPRYLRSS